MNDLILCINIPRHRSIRIGREPLSDKAIICLIDFDGLEDAKCLEDPRYLKKIKEVICPNTDSDYIEGNVYKINDYIEGKSDSKDLIGLYNRTINYLYIMKDKNNDLRIVRDSGIPIHSLLTRRIIEIPVFDTKEDLSSTEANKEAIHFIDACLFHKKICGTMPYIRSMEEFSCMSISDITNTAIDLNTRDIPEDYLGFLIVYHDCKMSTIEFVEDFFSNINNQLHVSVSIVNNKVSQVSRISDGIYFEEIPKEVTECDMIRRRLV